MIENDINKVDNVTIQYMYVGPCNCPDQVMCQWSQLNKMATANYSIISDLQEHSRYLFKITAYNPAGHNTSNEKNVTTFSAGKCLMMNVYSESTLSLISLIQLPVECQSRWMKRHSI